MHADEAISDTVRLIRETVSGVEAELIGLCDRLVRASSVSPPGDTREVAEVVRTELSAGDMLPEVVANNPARPSVLVTIDGAAPGPHLILNGHLDTMPPGEEAAWSVDPWTLTERDGRLYGLGMGNMKGAVAGLITATRLLAEQRDRWRGRVTLTAVADEVMFGPDGAAWLLDDRPELYGDALICGEGPGWMRLAVAEKGVAWYEVEAEGPAGHSSRARAGYSAIAKLAATIGRLDAVSGRTASLPAELRDIEPVEEDPGGILTMSAGTIEGGSVVSQLPTHAGASVDARIPPGVTLEDVDDLVRQACESIEGVRWRRTKGWNPNWTDPSASIVRAISVAAAQTRGTTPKQAVRVPASDASRWRSSGVPAVCFGPQPTFSAGIDEYAERRDVLDCAVIYTAAALSFLV